MAYNYSEDEFDYYNEHGVNNVGEDVCDSYHDKDPWLCFCSICRKTVTTLSLSALLGNSEKTFDKLLIKF